jgi:hypothetical protein
VKSKQNWMRNEKKMQAFLKLLSDFWLEYYTNNGHCSLCGNTGMIDTSNATTAAGMPTGRLNWCMCPNGLALRKAFNGEPGGCGFFSKETFCQYMEQMADKLTREGKNVRG